MHQYIWRICFLLLIFACSRKTEINHNTSHFVIEEEPIINVPDGQEYTFGYLHVPENRTIEGGNTIKLPVYIFKSKNIAPKPDPIIYLVGGPGSSIMGAVPYIKYYQYLEDRDFILVEQRGTKYAKPHLGCPEWGEATFYATANQLNEQLTDSLMQEASRECNDRLIKQGIDLNGYHTNESAADINDLVNALQIKSYNLLTISYGTKIAQVVMRDYPKRLRSVVLDSPLPLEVNYDEESIKNMLENFDKIFLDCASDATCNRAYPDLKKDFFAFLQNITDSPMMLKVKNPKNNNEEIFKIHGKDLISFLADINTAQLPGLPLLISQILQGDYSFIRSQLQQLLKSPGNGDGIGMRLSVWCAEEEPFNADAKIEEESSKYPAINGASPEVYDAKICDIWGVKPVGKKENLPIQSAVPTLIINGGYDHVTPVSWGNHLHQNLSNSFHLVFKGLGHGPTTYWDNPCGMKIARQFFNKPSESPTMPCFNALDSFKFEMPE